MNISEEELRNFIHDSTNKTATAKGMLDLVLKKDLGEKERKLVQKALVAINETIDQIKEIRSQLD